MKREKITVDLHKAKTTLSRLIAAAERSQQVMITRNGDPVVELGPVKPQTGRKPGTHPELHVGDEFFAPLSDEELDAW